MPRSELIKIKDKCFLAMNMTGCDAHPGHQCMQCVRDIWDHGHPLSVRAECSDPLGAWPLDNKVKCEILMTIFTLPVIIT